MKIPIFFLFLKISYAIIMKFPTMGYSAYTIVSVTNTSNIYEFNILLKFYAKIASSCNDKIEHRFYFGVNGNHTVTGINIQPDVEKWISNKNLLEKLYTSSLRNTSNLNYEYEVLKNKAQYIFKEIETENSVQETLPKKKIITLLTNNMNMNLNLTSLFNSTDCSDLNAEIFVMTTMSEDLHNLTQECHHIKVFQVDFENLTEFEKEFCEDIPLTVISNINKTNAQSHVYIKDGSNISNILGPILETIANGSLTQLGHNDIYSNFVNVHISNGNDVIMIPVPWIGNETQEFLQHATQNFNFPTQEKKVLSKAKRVRRVNSNMPITCGETSGLYENLMSDMENSTKSENNPNLASFTLYSNEIPECLKDLVLENKIIGKNFTANFQIIVPSEVNSKDLYLNFIKPLHNFLPHPQSFQVVQISNPSETPDVLTAGTSTMTPIPLVGASETVYKEPWDLAWEQFFAVLFLCTASVLIIGTYFYYKRKRFELLKTEMFRDEESRRSSRDFSKNAPSLNNRLCWEVHHERVHIDYEFPVSEGNNDVVYLGRLKGKAPIMQWINLTEMKQFQDCAVAVRVPRRFDIEEEKQLEREINAMKAIKHHDYVAVLLGWTNKNSLVCTVLELTHTNLMKYLSMLKDGMSMNETSLTTASMMPYKQYLRIIVMVTDAMAYIASKGLVHRDLSAKNILLTTGLRAKVSGFSFCSLVGDESFHPSKPAFSWLPLRYMAIEAILDGRFSERSDVWSFGMVLYEMYTLGEEPFGNLKTDVFLKNLRNGERPKCPDFATEEIYAIMSKCWYRYPERRPNFVDLNNNFQQILERQYENPAFEFEHNE